MGYQPRQRKGDVARMRPPGPHFRPAQWFDPPRWVRDHEAWRSAVGEVALCLGETAPTAEHRASALFRLQRHADRVLMAAEDGECG